MYSIHPHIHLHTYTSIQKPAQLQVPVMDNAFYKFTAVKLWLRLGS